MVQLGLCCKFAKEPIQFRTTMANVVSKLTRSDGLGKISKLCLHNAGALLETLHYCHRVGIGGFRVTSQVLPLFTHPATGYEPRELPDFKEIRRKFEECRQFAQSANIRLTFHPDQFIVLNSPTLAVVAASIPELNYQAMVSEWIGADVLNIHVGGGYGDKAAAMRRFADVVERLDPRVRSRLTVENDDTTYTVADLLPLCKELGVPLVYDVHHHRCNADDLSVEEATERAMRTWNRRPLFHLSSPRGGWRASRPSLHHDYINPKDFPRCWMKLDVTIEVEAKAKELAILRLMRSLRRRECLAFSE